MSIKGRVERCKSAGGRDEKSVVYTTPDGTSCTLRVSVGTNDSATITLRDYTFDSEGTTVDVNVETTGSVHRRMGVHKINNTGNALEVAEDTTAGPFVIAYGVPFVRVGAMFVHADTELDTMLVAHIYCTRERSFSVVAQIWCDSAKGLEYHMTELTQHSSPKEALEAVRLHLYDCINTFSFTIDDSCLDGQRLGRSECIPFKDQVTSSKESPQSLRKPHSLGKIGLEGFELVHKYCSDNRKRLQEKCISKRLISHSWKPVDKIASSQQFCHREPLDTLNFKGCQYSGQLNVNMAISQPRFPKNVLLLPSDGHFAFARRKTEDGNSTTIQRMKPTNGNSIRWQMTDTGRISNRGGQIRGDFNGSVININISIKIFFNVVTKYFW